MRKSPGRASPVGARRAGVLLHVTSLPGRHGVGDLGAGAHGFAELAASCGFSVWQILPLHPVDASGSPYSGLSAFAGNPLLVDLDDLVARGLLERRDLRGAPRFAPGVADYRAAAAFKRPLLAKAARALLADRGGAFGESFAAFCREAGPIWLDDAALHAALAARHRGAPWWRWDAPLKRRNAGAIRAARDGSARRIDVYRAVQFLFELQWRALAARCSELGVRLLGDVPLYVARRAVDVWARPELFALDRALRPRAVAGVPPDYFSAKGQLWGNPVYRWRAHREEGFRWWTARLGRELELADWARLDHFRGLAACWEVPAGARDARRGRWVRTPGRELLLAAKAALGGAPFVAEDLGVIDGEVIALRDAFDLPGMAVLQFGFGDGAGEEHLPQNHRERQVVYTGTHDNDTLVGWWRSAGRDVREHARRVLGARGAEREIARRLVAAALGSVARLAVIPMQDLLGAGSEARMNTPGSPPGASWRWRLRGGELTPRRADAIRGMIEASGRAPN
jgi:4-alpha-glucanotransferase